MSHWIKRNCIVNRCRIRLGLSHLNSHLHHYNLIDSPSCSNPECGRTPESAAHYFLSCPRYNNERCVLFESLSRKLFPNVNYNTFIVLMPDHICTILLEGSEDASYEENTSIFDEVFKYIDSTQRVGGLIHYCILYCRTKKTISKLHNL